jgi:hypothetical protein
MFKKGFFLDGVCVKDNQCLVSIRLFGPCYMVPPSNFIYYEMTPMYPSKKFLKSKNMNKLGVGIGYRIVCENKHNLNEQNRIKVQPQFVEKEPLTI